MDTASPEAAMAFYAEHINRQRFDALLPVIAEDAVFWFNDGSHAGLAAIRQAFETIWSRIEDEVYWLEDLRWPAKGGDAAACVYRYRWRGRIDGVEHEGGGRGTSVLRREPGGWMIVHEHLSRNPD